MDGGSKFENCRTDIEGHFHGPYRLDERIIEAVLSRRPGIYIWFTQTPYGDLGYVGRSKDVVQRLTAHARQTRAKFFVQYCSLDDLEKLEQSWIDRAGDLNLVSASTKQTNKTAEEKDLS